MCLAIPGRIEKLYTREDGAPMASTDFDGEMREICLAYMPHLGVGAYTIVHAGFALTEVAEEEAMRIINTMRENEILPAEGLGNAQGFGSVQDNAVEADVSPESSVAEDPTISYVDFSSGLTPGLDYCVTCSDEGREAVILSLPEMFGLPGRVRTLDGKEEEVDLTLVPEAQVGSHILIHAGGAIAVVEGVEA